MRSTTDAARPGLLHELTPEECWRHLEQHHVGRISYVDRGYPVILPLNYEVRDQQVYVQTASYNQLAIHLPGQHAAFEIDHVDEHARAGWSVLVRGVAEHVMGDGHDRASSPAEAAPWPDGTRSMVFRIVPVEVTGRVLRQQDTTPDAGHGPGTIQRSPAAPLA
jgi:uncharacterized protein